MHAHVPQNYLRKQDYSKTSYNLILETLRFLDCLCGATTGGLVLLSLYVHSNNVCLINQCLAALTEYCQGPCHDNQVCRGGLAVKCFVHPKCAYSVRVQQAAA